MNFPQLDAREEHFRIPGPRAGMSLFLRFLPATATTTATAAALGRSVLYVHGATFPSALSIAHRFDGESWRDALCAAGFDVWGLDFYGFGFSDRYPEMSRPAEQGDVLCTADDAAAQIAAAAHFIVAHSGQLLSLIAHSWGSMPACQFAGDHPALIDRLVLFGPIAPRITARHEPAPPLPAWRIVTLADQWNRFVEDVPAGEAPVLSRTHFEEWGERYLDSDPESRRRDPPGVRTPLGPLNDVIRAWQGQLAYDPARVQAPLAIIRGAWDGVFTDADARVLFDAFVRSSNKRDIKIARGTHLMHLETMRLALWMESITFLSGADVAASRAA